MFFLLSQNSEQQSLPLPVLILKMSNISCQLKNSAVDNCIAAFILVHGDKRICDVFTCIHARWDILLEMNSP